MRRAGRSTSPLEREFDARVLLAEDNEANQMVANEILSRLGIDLDIANNGREALDMVQAGSGQVRRRPDGHADARDGRSGGHAGDARGPGVHDLPIIAMTANAMKADLDACLAAGMNDLITKPIERKALLQTLRRWLPARRACEAAAAGRSEPAAVSSAGSQDADRTTLRRSKASTWQGSLARLGLEFETLRRCSSGLRTVRAHARSAACGRGGGRQRRRGADTRTPSRDRRATSAPTTFGRRQGARARRPRGQHRRLSRILLADVEARAAVVCRSIDTAP